MRRGHGWSPPTRYTKPPSPERPRDPDAKAVKDAVRKRELRAERNRRVAENGGAVCR